MPRSLSRKTAASICSLALLLAGSARAGEGPAAKPDPVASQGAAGKKGPQAGLLVPRAVIKARSPVDEDDEQPLSAFASPEVLDALGPLAPELGSFAEYSIRQRGLETTRLRISALPPKEAEGRVWLELATLSGGALPVAARLLVHGNPGRAADIERTLIYVAGQAAFEVPMEEVLPAIPKARPAPEVKVTRLGRVERKVPAGAFQADLLRVVQGKETTKVWRSAEVPIFGLVRAETGKRTVELVSFGHSGAHSVIPPGPGETAAPGSPPPGAH